jgi:hypothetical protein
MPSRVLFQIICDCCQALFEVEQNTLFTSTSEAEMAAFSAGWAKDRYHNKYLYACPVCQEQGRKAVGV